MSNLNNSHRAAKLPALPGVRTDNPALNAWIDAVRERLEVREGNRGDPWERAVTLRDLDSAGVAVGGLSRRSAFGGGGVTDTGTGTGGINVDGLLGGSLLFTDLLKEVQRLRSGEDLPARVRDLIAISITEEARLRGSDIRSVTHQLQTEVESFASKVDEITASISGAQAGIRQVSYASTTENNATAGRLTTLTAALDGVGSSTFSESIQVIADRIAGLRSTWMLQVNAGGAVSGISLLASEDPSGATRSAFVVEADNFVVAAPINFTRPTAPTATAIGQIWFNPTNKEYKRASATGTGGWVAYVPSAPFGVDTTTGTVYINGQLRVNAGGGTIADIATTAGRYTDYIFLRAATAPATPTGTAPAGWSDAPPAGTNPLYMSKVIRERSGALVGTWSVPVRLDGAVGATGQYTEYQYALNTSTTAAPTTGWQASPPPVGTGQFLWMQTRVVTPPAAAPAWATAVRISGEKGGEGTPGDRGSLTGYGSRYSIVSNAWSDVQANAVIYNLLNGTTSTSWATTTHLRLGDTVTLSNGTNFAATRYWGGGAWLVPGVVIDGNLLVSGSVTADRIDTRNLTIKNNLGEVIFSAGVGLDGAYIKRAAIDTLQIAPGAATTIYGAQPPAPGVVAISDVTSDPTTVTSLNVVRDGAAALFGTVSFVLDSGVPAYRPDAFPGNGGSLRFEVVRQADGAVIHGFVMTVTRLQSVPVSFSYTDTWPTSTAYALRVSQLTINQNHQHALKSVLMTGILSKR